MTPSAVGSAIAPAFITEAQRYRELGGDRPRLVDYLVRCGVDELSAEQLADRFDVELCLAGAPRPADISAQAASYLDTHGAAAPVQPAVPPVPAPAPHPRNSSAPSAPSAGAALTALELARGMADRPTPATAPDPGSAAPSSSIAASQPVTPASPPGSGRPALQPMPAGVTATIGAPSVEEDAAGFAVTAPPREAPPAMPAPTAAPMSPPTTQVAATAVETPLPDTLDRPQAQQTAAVRSAPQPETVPAPAPAEPPTSTDETTWNETTEFGYRIAQSWDDADPNEAINQAAALARSGKTQEEIVDFLRSCNVSQGEAEYVAAMSGARRATPNKPAEGAAKVRTRNRRRQRMLAVAMIVAGAVVGYLGYHGWASAGDSVATARMPLSLTVVGAALALNGIRTLFRR